ncbi:helix-turn-helix transcriptional regulator [Lactococcus lactis]|uniref:helix-turn-helix domain-containing protein n=1 Tax=Lactococcus lactis TaxID=1358 RepID=UPI00288F1DFA|nr:helix-turn-helix transcriptional regulator [Lactococcus lactis]MDT2850644.1 helix-turn-helix transcriptional regulator [Lactococcus lactis]MDT2875823.1 helix-turn-helix transcriptional regulator [Lactococcus lactis]MDT2879235.1 helix-turn-helix transcriptional regulator [Lactococcus lactis]MDT2883014.1 helix-turn-helix transcriptional regulator [Lactococcus lactis]MDT2899738.1 helix-turn-helix transcriptional regulator [Lactococcus lactis]
MDINAKSVGSRINDIRLSLGLSMEQFGKLFNTSKGTVNNWEKGRNLPNKENLLKISNLGDTTIEYILHGTMDEYIDNLITKLQKDLLADKSISNAVIPFIVSEVKSIMYSNASSFLNTEQADKKFNETKKYTIESWSDPESLERKILMNLSRELRTRILDTMKYSYKSYYNNDNEETSAGDYLTENSREILERLHSLEDFLDAYFDALRFLDDSKIASKLDSLRDFTKKIDQRIK